jgi:hypothetical protein
MDKRLQLKRLMLTAICIGLLAVMGCAGAATTQAFSSAVPMGGDRQYHKIVVYVYDAGDPALQEKVERAFADQLRSAGADACTSMTVAPNASMRDVGKQAKAQGCDGILVIKMINATTNTTHSPPLHIQKPLWTFSNVLYDLNNNLPVWNCTSTTGGNAFANADVMFNSLATQSVSNLKKDGLI